MDSKKFIEFLLLTGKLKETERTGWVRNGIPKPESVADHSFRTAILAMMLADDLNADRDIMIKMALIHDIGECIIGDIPPKDIDKKEKYDKEKKAVEHLAKLSNNKELLELWLEYEKGETQEAQYIQQIDKLEMVIQALEYEKRYKKDLRSFFETSKKEIKNQKLISIYELILKNRKIIK